jgi:hypothetical protein
MTIPHTHSRASADITRNAPAYTPITSSHLAISQISMDTKRRRENSLRRYQILKLIIAVTATAVSVPKEYTARRLSATAPRRDTPTRIKWLV